MTYEMIKAAHVASVLVFVGGLVLLLVANRIAASSPAATTSAVRDGVMYWDRRVTSPALLLAWIFGIWVAVQSGAFSDVWLHLKLALVIALSGLHGMLSGRLRREKITSNTAMQVQSILVVLGLVSIAILAVVKPF